MQRAGRSGRSSRIALAAPRASSPFPLIAGVVGGFVLLLLIIAAASAGGGGRKAPPRREEAPAPPPAEPARSPEETGPIMFVCSNSPKHPDKEVLISICPGCGARARFYWDRSIDGYRCLPCRQPFPRYDVKCPECGKVPRTHRIKHRPG